MMSVGGLSVQWVQTWSCWASWFSRPSTIEANLSLLFRSAAIVMAAKILSKLGGEGGWRQRGGTTQKSTLLSPSWQDIYSHFLAQTSPILSPSPRHTGRGIFARPGCGHCGHCWRFQFLLCTLWSIVAKVTTDKDRTGDANVLARLSRQRCRRVPVQTWPKRTLINQCTRWPLKEAHTKGACRPTIASKTECSVFRYEKRVARSLENIPYSRRENLSRLQPLFFFHSSSIMSEERDCGVRHPRTSFLFTVLTIKLENRSVIIFPSTVYTLCFSFLKN